MLQHHRITRLAFLGWIACLGCNSQTPVETTHRDAPPANSPVAPQAAGTGPSSRQAKNEWLTQLQLAREGQSDRIQVDSQVITAEQLEQLEQVPNLTELLLDAGVVCDADLGHIAQLHKLEHLRLRDSPLTDAGAEQLADGLPKLRILNLPQAELTAAGIRHFARNSNLTQLRLGGSHIDDAALAAMAELPELRSLHLIGPKLSDAALEALAASPKLTSFYLDDCPLSDAAWERLFDAKPSLHVHIDQAHHDRDPSYHGH